MDYEPFAVPMGYPVLEDINFKSELKRMDMAIARTMQQAVLLVTTGTDPEKGGVNQKNLIELVNFLIYLLDLPKLETVLEVNFWYQIYLPKTKLIISLELKK